MFFGFSSLLMSGVRPHGDIWGFIQEKNTLYEAENTVTLYSITVFQLVSEINMLRY